ncbi:MAG: Hsp33 family molecular chaperone HslO [Alphaproteobacteria bacterium]|jgi:molecular chaperone Hsp33|nr:Hsp33 family molecular chaperone HslO [Alphaproteobacteria bacterium]
MADLDRVLGFTIASRHARGRVVRLGPVLEQVLQAHGYPPAVEKLLAEALVIAALLGTTLKSDDGQMTMQAQTEDGAIQLLVCDYRAGEVRGYVKHDPEKIAALPHDPDLQTLFGKGYLAITFDQAVTNERYQGIVPLEGAHLGEAIEHYFAQSEQIPSLVRTAISGEVAGGILVQHLPEGEVGRERLHVRHDHPEWEHVSIITHTISPEELTDPELGLDDIVWRLFHEEDQVRILDGQALHKGCRCDADYVRSVLMRFSPEERQDMADEAGVISIDCAFCSKVFPVHI